MANKNTRSRNSKTSASRSRPSRRLGFSAWLSRLSRTNMIIIAAFVLVFAGVGTIYLRQSRADSLYGYSCVYYKFSEYKAWGSQCVKDIQYGLLKNGQNVGTIDGKFGPQTYAAVKAFGRDNGYDNSGEVGVRTWNSLCKSGLSYPVGYGYFPYVAVAAGCMTGQNANGPYRYVSSFGGISL